MSERLTWLDEFERVNREVERNSEWFEDSEEWTLEGYEAPVSEEMVQYNLGPVEKILEAWVKAQEEVKETRREYWKELGRKPYEAEIYSEAEDRILRNTEFLEEVYGLDENLMEMKVKVRYE